MDILAIKGSMKIFQSQFASNIRLSKPIPQYPIRLTLSHCRVSKSGKQSPSSLEQLSPCRTSILPAMYTLCVRRVSSKRWISSACCCRDDGNIINVKESHASLRLLCHYTARPYAWKNCETSNITMHKDDISIWKLADLWWRWISVTSMQ